MREGDALVVWRLDRLGRNLTDPVRLIAELEHRTIHFKSEDVKNARPLYSALSQSDQVVFREKTSTIRMRMENGNLFLPITVEGKQANYIFDSGAHISVLSESEAARLSLVVRNVDTQLGDSTGAHVSSRVTTAKDLVIGDLHRKNVAFAVLPDAQ